MDKQKKQHKSHTRLYMLYTTHCTITVHGCKISHLTFFSVFFFFIVSSFLCYYEKELIKSVLFHDLFHDSSGMPHAK